MKNAQDFWITAAEWNGIYGSSYEIGIRQKAGEEKFFLLQGGWNERTVVVAAEAVRMMLDGGFTPTEIIESVFP